MIRQARRHEFSTIEAWRRIHFARMDTGREVVGQRGFDEAVWLVADKDGVPIAAASFTDDAANRRRYIHDLYAAPGHALAGAAMGDFLERMADDQGYELRGSTDPENVRYLRYIERRGYELTAVEFRRRPRARTGVGEESGNPASDEGRGFCLEEVHGSVQ